MNKTYQKLIQDLENAINDLDNQVFADLQENVDYKYWQAHEYCKDLSYKKCQIIDLLRK